MKKIMLFATIFALGLPVFIGNVFAGTLTTQECSPEPCSYSFSGEITLSDIDRFMTIRATSTDTVMPVFLDSPGGNVYAALRIAEILDAKKAMVIIKKESSCYSSCVFIFAGGVMRSNHGKIGIHSVYSLNLDDTYGMSEKRLAEIEAQVKSLLRHSGISESLWTEMQQVPPEKIKLLSDKEMRTMRLIGSTPAYRDYQEVRTAKDLGISRQELISRRQTSIRLCGDPPKGNGAFAKWNACDNKVIGWSK